MTWRVTIRGEDGKRKFKDINASSRQELFSLLKEEGIVAIRVDAINEKDLKHSGNSIILFKKIIFSLLVCVAIFTGIFLLYRFFDEPSKVSPTPKQTPHTKPATQPIQVTTGKVTKIEIVQDTPASNQIETYHDERGILRYKGGLRVYKGDADKSELRPGVKQIFSNVADREISHLFTIKPGSLVIGTKNYGDQFVKNFLKSINEPLVYDKNDTESERELRKLVYEAKQTLKEAYDRGEDIGQIMKESRLELQRIGQYKRQIEKTLMESIKSEAVTSDDISDYVTAANKLLEEKGSSPIRLNVLLRKVLMKQIRNEK